MGGGLPILQRASPDNVRQPLQRAIGLLAFLTSAPIQPMLFSDHMMCMAQVLVAGEEMGLREPVWKCYFTAQEHLHRILLTSDALLSTLVQIILSCVTNTLL